MSGVPHRQQSTETVLKLYNGKLRIERRNGSPNLFARTYLQGKSVSKSTGEQTIGAATTVATNWYLALLDRIRKGEHLHEPTFSEVADRFFVHAETRLNAGQFKNLRDKWHLLKPHFENVKLSDIDARWLDALREKRAKDRTRTGRAVKSATIKKDLLFVRRVLRYAKEWEKLLHELPEFPSFNDARWEILPSPRPFFKREQYKLLLKFAFRRMKERNLNPRTREQRRELYYFIIICVSAALRVGEALSLRWRDCKHGLLSGDESQPVLWMRVLGKHSRTGNRDRRRTQEREDACGGPIALAAYYRMAVARRRLETYPEYDPDEKVFLHHHRDGFRELVITAGLRNVKGDDDGPGQTRDLKSLRPTGITLRLDGPNAPNYRDIAKWARTSVAMVEKFYDQSQPEQHVNRVLGRSVAPSAAKADMAAPPQPKEPVPWNWIPVPDNLMSASAEERQKFTQDLIKRARVGLDD
jgi:integrase